MIKDLINLHMLLILLLSGISSVSGDSSSDRMSYSIWDKEEGRRVTISYTTDFGNPNGSDVIVWAIPSKLAVEAGEAFSITGCFRNASDRFIYLPNLDEWYATIKTSGQVGFSSQAAKKGHSEPLKVEPGETIMKTIVLNDPNLSGEFLQVRVQWGLYAIDTDKIYLRRTSGD